MALGRAFGSEKSCLCIRTVPREESCSVLVDPCPMKGADALVAEVGLLGNSRLPFERLRATHITPKSRAPRRPPQKNPLKMPRRTTGSLSMSSLEHPRRCQGRWWQLTYMGVSTGLGVVFSWMEPCQLHGDVLYDGCFLFTCHSGLSEQRE